MITNTEDLGSIQKDLIDAFDRKIKSPHLDTFHNEREFIISAKQRFEDVIKRGNGLDTARLLLNETKIQRAILTSISVPQPVNNNQEEIAPSLKSLANEQIRRTFENLIGDIKAFISKSESLKKAKFDQIIDSSESLQKKEEYLHQKISEHTISIDDSKENRKSTKYSELSISINNNNNLAFPQSIDFNSRQKPSRTFDDFMLFDPNSELPIPMLHYCIMMNDHVIAGQLINNPENLALLNMQDFNGDTPLLLALRKNQFQIASLLCFHSETDLSKSNYIGEAPIHVIAQFPVKDIIDLKERQTREKEIVSFMKALFYKLENSGKKQYLLSSTYQLRTPLLIATEMENFALVQFLIQQGADPTQSDFEGNTFIHYAVCSGNLEFFENILDLVDDFSLQFRLIGLGKKETKNIFTYQNSYGETILMLAIQSGHESLVKLILDRTPCLNEISCTTSKSIFNIDYKRKRTALHYAVEKININIVQLLINKKADANLTDEAEKTPLHCAIQDDNLEMVKILVEGKANPRQTDKNGESSIDYAKNKKNIKDYLDLFLAKNKKEFIVERISDLSV